MSLAYFNFALFPEDKQFIAECIELARKNFSGHASEYLLEEGKAWPHVTLCQFEAEPDRLDEVWQLSQRMQFSIALRFHHMYVLPGADQHDGKHWLGLAVGTNSTLMEMQASLHKRLAEIEIYSWTMPNCYFPHLSMARCQLATAEPLSLISLPAASLWKEEHVFSLSIAASNQNGVYRERLYPSR